MAAIIDHTAHSRGHSTAQRNERFANHAQTAIAVKTPTISTASGGCGRSMGGFAFSRSESKPRKWWTRKLRERGRRRGHSSERPCAMPMPIVLHRSYTIALYGHYLSYVVPLLSYCVGIGLTRPHGNATPHPVADKLISLFLRHVDLASARESLCRGLGSSWFTERFHRNALVTHFQHDQIFCAARQLKDYAVTRCRLHQRAPQR